MVGNLYTQDEVLGILMNLVNGIGLYARSDNMPKRYKQMMTINGEDHWVSGATLKDLLEGYLQLCIDEGTVVPAIVMKSEDKKDIPILDDYMKNFNELYKNNQQSLTKVARQRSIDLHISPRFGQKRLDEISTNDIQKWFNELEEKGYSHESLLKIKNVLSPVMDAAVEDGYISRNPFKSTKLTIGGKETVHHKAIPEDIMKKIREEIPELSDVRVRRMITLFTYTGMRMEEVLGLRWEDLDYTNNWIYIQRAVVHPHRNQPEVKQPKTKTSTRRIPLPEAVRRNLIPTSNKGFILHASDDDTCERPMSYTEARRVFNKIRSTFGLQEYSAHDFRDTCATEWREAGVPLDVISHMLGHAKSDITENRYVKYRDELYQGVRAVMSKPDGTNYGTNC